MQRRRKQEGTGRSHADPATLRSPRRTRGPARALGPRPALSDAFHGNRGLATAPPRCVAAGVLRHRGAPEVTRAVAGDPGSDCCGWLLLTDSWPAMGCDGGTIPKRHELVKGPKKVEKVSHVGRVGTGGGETPRERGEVGQGEPAGFQTQLRSFIPFRELKINNKR